MSYFFCHKRSTVVILLTTFNFQEHFQSGLRSLPDSLVHFIFCFITTEECGLINSYLSLYFFDYLNSQLKIPSSFFRFHFSIWDEIIRDDNFRAFLWLEKQIKPPIFQNSIMETALDNGNVEIAKYYFFKYQKLQSQELQKWILLIQTNDEYFYKSSISNWNEINVETIEFMFRYGLINLSQNIYKIPKIADRVYK